MNLTDVIAAIEAGPKGAEIGAFFDFDGTLIDGYSALAYYKERFWNRKLGWDEFIDICKMVFSPNINESKFAEFMGKSMAKWADCPENEIVELWSGLFKTKIAALLFPEAWRLVKAHQKMGHTVVIASSATRYQVTPLAEALGVTHILCTRVKVDEGRLTGQIEGMPLWGQGKADAVRVFAQEHQLMLSLSYAYANGNEDIAFLKTVRHPSAVNPKPALLALATRENWRILHFPVRRKASLVSRLRSFGAYCVLLLNASGSLIYGLITGKKRKAAEWVSMTSSQVMLAISGIHIDVVGEQHLVDHRPSLFIFNHQSFLDAYVLICLLKKGFTGVAKQEVLNIPLIGKLLQSLDFAFIDRSNTRSAIDAMAPAIERLQTGLSMVMAPEGTRSLTPKLGHFKKGAFHLAMQAGVPMVPIVIRNDYEMMTRNSLLFRPGTVQVCVLPPIDVSEWTVETLDAHMNDVRKLFQDTLDNWPEK